MKRVIILIVLNILFFNVCTNLFGQTKIDENIYGEWYLEYNKWNTNSRADLLIFENDSVYITPEIWACGPFSSKSNINLVKDSILISTKTEYYDVETNQITETKYSSSHLRIIDLKKNRLSILNPFNNKIKHYIKFIDSSDIIELLTSKKWGRKASYGYCSFEFSPLKQMKNISDSTYIEYDFDKTGYLYVNSNNLRDTFNWVLKSDYSLEMIPTSRYRKPIVVQLRERDEHYIVFALKENYSEKHPLLINNHGFYRTNKGSKPNIGLSLDSYKSFNLNTEEVEYIGTYEINQNEIILYPEFIQKYLESSKWKFVKQNPIILEFRNTIDDKIIIQYEFIKGKFVILK